MDPILSVALPGAGAVGPSAPLPPASAPVADARDFAAMMNLGSPGSTVEAAFSNSVNEMSSRYSDMTSQWHDFKVDFKDPAAMVHVLDAQAKVTGASLHVQMALQTAETTRTSFQKLFQQQS